MNSTTGKVAFSQGDFDRILGWFWPKKTCISTEFVMWNSTVKISMVKIEILTDPPKLWQKGILSKWLWRIILTGLICCPSKHISTEVSTRKIGFDGNFYDGRSVRIDVAKFEFGKIWRLSWYFDQFCQNFCGNPSGESIKISIRSTFWQTRFNHNCVGW